MRKEWIFSILMFFLLFPAKTHSIKTNSEELEWKVRLGEQNTYTLNKFMRNGDNISEIETQNGTKLSITLKRGTNITIELTRLREDYAYGKITYGNITTKEDELPYFVTPTTHNKKYWEDWTEEGHPYFCGMTVVLEFSRSVKGDIITEKEKIKDGGKLFERKKSRNWKTGWLAFLYKKTTADDGTVLEEEEIQQLGYDELIPLDAPISQPIFFAIACVSALSGGMGLAYLYEKMRKI